MGATTEIHRRILDLLSENPQGLSITEIRRMLKLKGTEHQHLDRRVRDLDAAYEIERVRDRGALLYVLKGLRTSPRGRVPIRPKIRAEVLSEAQGACAMCGRTIKEDGIKLQIDHIIPVEWGGTSDKWNLQALCAEDNAAKKASYSGFDPRVMKRVFSHSKVHQRIGELLIQMRPNYVEGWLIGRVAQQEDWHKRLRELRVLGWEISFRKTKQPNGRVTTAYKVEKWTRLSGDPAQDIRKLERARGAKR